MHGYFIDIRLYRKAKSVAEPFAFEEYRRRKIREKIEEDRTNRVQIQVILNNYLLNKRSVYFFLYEVNYLPNFSNTITYF